MSQELDLNELKTAARDFIAQQSQLTVANLYRVTDGKAAGTFVEQAFRTYLTACYIYRPGNSALGIDFPELGVDLKVTSVRQPQSSSPFASASQKVYGLGYHLLVFIYEKLDDDATATARLNFLHAIFIPKERTADYQTTYGLRGILERGGNLDDVAAFLEERNLPLDDIGRTSLAERILREPPLLATSPCQMRYSGGSNTDGRLVLLAQRGPKDWRTCLKREFGDFPTPPALVDAVLDRLLAEGLRWGRVLEPTCGSGHFISGLLRHYPPPDEVLGFDLNPDYVAEAASLAGTFTSTQVRVAQANFFALDLRHDLPWQTSGPLLVVGNPPWVTNAELGVLGSANLPPKHNLKGLPGLDARTGSANFDLAESIWLKLL